MSQAWQTQNHDMRIAAQIINKHVEENDGKPLGLFEISLKGKNKQAKVRLSNWILEMTEHFYTQYGRAQGDFVTKMVLTKCLTNGKTIH